MIQDTFGLTDRSNKKTLVLEERQTIHYDPTDLNKTNDSIF
jgi:hypothetical protein